MITLSWPASSIPEATASLIEKRLSTRRSDGRSFTAKATPMIVRASPRTWGSASSSSGNSMPTLMKKIGMKNPNEAGAASVDYLHLFGWTAMAYVWARTAKVSLAALGGDE